MKPADFTTVVFASDEFSLQTLVAKTVVLCFVLFLHRAADFLRRALVFHVSEVALVQLWVFVDQVFQFLLNFEICVENFLFELLRNQDLLFLQTNLFLNQLILLFFSLFLFHLLSYGVDSLVELSNQRDELRGVVGEELEFVELFFHKRKL
jgi:hypothetical protein